MYITIPVNKQWLEYERPRFAYVINKEGEVILNDIVIYCADNAVSTSPPSANKMSSLKCGATI